MIAQRALHVNTKSIRLTPELLNHRNCANIIDWSHLNGHVQQVLDADQPVIQIIRYRKVVGTV